MRLAYLGGCRWSSGAAPYLHHDPDMLEWAARLKVGPLIHLEFVSHHEVSWKRPMDKNCMTGSSIHAAKGLEWDVVFCPQRNARFMLGGYYAGGAPGVQ